MNATAEDMRDSVAFDPIKDANNPAAQHMYAHLAAYTNEELLQAIYEKGKLRGQETSECVHYITDDPYPLGEHKQEVIRRMNRT